MARIAIDAGASALGLVTAMPSGPDVISDDRARRIVAAVPCPVYLAGGLGPGNVAEAIRAVRPFGVDLCSGVRTDGRLDAQKLGALMVQVHAAAQS